MYCRFSVVSHADRFWMDWIAAAIDPARGVGPDHVTMETEFVERRTVAASESKFPNITGRLRRKGEKEAIAM